MAAYKLTYFPFRARAEVIRLIFAQTGVEYENERLPFLPSSAEWQAKKKSKLFTIMISVSVYNAVQYQCPVIYYTACVLL